MLTLTSDQIIWAHRVPAAIKLAALCATTVGLFALDNGAALGLAALAAAALVLSGGAAFAKQSVAMLRPLWPFVLLVAVWHAAFADPAGAAIITRMMTAVALANFVTMTTRLSDMIDVIATLCRPLARLGIKPLTLAVAVALVIRVVPVMLQRAQIIADAWRARAVTRARVRVLMPLTLAALDDAEHMTDALRARGGLG